MQTFGRPGQSWKMQANLAVAIVQCIKIYEMYRIAWKTKAQLCRFNSLHRVESTVDIVYYHEHPYLRQGNMTHKWYMLNEIARSG